MMTSRPLLCAFSALCLTAFPLAAQSHKITTPKQVLGFQLGDDYRVANYTQLEAYWKKLAGESDRMKLEDIGPTAEGRRQYMAIITDPENLKRLDHYKQISQKLAHAEGLSEKEARTLAKDGKAVVWIDGGLHATETVGSQQIMETVYQLVSRNDEETRRLLKDVIVLCSLVNPDGQELVANWYMREPDEKKRSMEGLPRLYHKYVGHDNNRDFFMSNMPETTNINRQLFIEWCPQIMYNHHQTGPRGTVIFAPPFRDPFNYHYDPLIMTELDLVGAAIHSRFIAEGKPGSATRSVASYSTWYNGGLRTVTYFHNIIGLLTEIIGSPTPMEIPLVPERQLPIGDLPAPIAPQPWHYRQSIEYELTANWAVLDVASRYRETLLFNIWRMGMNSIERGNKDSWTTTPQRIEALKEAMTPAKGSGSRRQSGAAEPAEPAGATAKPESLYETVLHKPEWRDPRGYILPADQADFPTATAFINTLIKNGVTVHRATADFKVAGKPYPKGSYVVKAAQAFRPHVLDMFEPQDHPNDFRYPGGPPVPPYDVTGYTLAYQMGVQFDRILDGFDGPFEVLKGLQTPPPATVHGAPNAKGYLISHRINNSFILTNRLLKAGCEVYWLPSAPTAASRLGNGVLWVPASSTSTPIVEAAAKSLGVEAVASVQTPASEALRINPVKLGLYDQYGGLMTSGWTRWLLEQFEFPFEVVYPQGLDAGKLKSRFDVLLFTDGAYRRRGSEDGERGGFRQPETNSIPAEYRAWLGSITADKTMPELRKFTEAGGTIITIGSANWLSAALGAPVKDALTEKTGDGKERPLSREKYYIPGSVLQTRVDVTSPLAYGLTENTDVFFDQSPVFRFDAETLANRVKPVAWYPNATPLRSGWAWGQRYLEGGVAVAEVPSGTGKMLLLGPEVAFRAQPHGTFKFLFNGIFYGAATTARLQ